MWSNIQILGFGLALATLSSAIPATSVPVGEVGPYDSELYSSFTKRIISPAGDDTCGLLYNGGNKGYSCDASINLGGCCSQYGYCGNATGMYLKFGTGGLYTNLITQRVLRRRLSD
jgi:hypothetical protein